MRSRRMGVTLIELIITLALLGVLAALAAPPIRSVIEVLAVRGARESAFAAFARARALALQHGGAEIELHAGADRITVRTPDGNVEHEVSLAAQHVDLLPGGLTDPVILRYDAYGLGRMMSRTITFEAGAVRAGLVVSSFGRVRRW